MKRLLPLILLLLCSAAVAESGAYRVEVIIFRNLAVMAEAAEVEGLRSFSHLPDLEESAPPVDLPDDLQVLTRKSPQIEEAWRRLRSSRDYRPLLYAAWEQNRVDYYPPMRVHNQQIIDTQLRPPTHIMVADLTAEDPLAVYRSTFYQLDGSLQLRRSRFLHLFLDLEYREEKLQETTEAGFYTETTIQTETEPGTGNSIDYGVFALKQNRQIHTGRMQYFDTPYFGTLVLVSAIKAKKLPD